MLIDDLDYLANVLILNYYLQLIEKKNIYKLLLIIENKKFFF